MVALSIAKLRVGAEAYQLSGVAASLTDYYTGAGEAAGSWVGRGSGVLGLSGTVDGDDLRVVLAGIAPRSGGLSPNGLTPTVNARRVPGFDLTFKVPKSVSVLYAVSDDPRVQGAIIDAGNTAVEQAIGWLEREAIRVRRGSNNKPWVEAQHAAGNSNAGIRNLETSGLVAAAFRHRTSRAGDPFLHWHVLAANMVQGTDGRWSAFVHPTLYQHARAAGEVFQAIVRDELTRTLGLEWRPGRHVNEVAGVPDSIMTTFSKRRAEIEAFTTANGLPADAAGNQAAALATRRSKAEQEATSGLSERWRAEAIDAGWGPEQAADILTAGRPREAGVHGVWRLPTVWFDPDGVAHNADRLVDPEEWIADVLRRDLTADRSTFTAADLVQAVAHRLGDGAAMATIERVANRILASGLVLPVETQRGETTFTSRELHAVEARFITTLNTAPTISGPASEQLAAVLADRPNLGPDQAAAIRALVSAHQSVTVLVGPAGTGKTYTLDTLRLVYETARYTVVGTAPSARAAAELESGAGIASSTMHSLLARHEHGMVSFGPSTVLVIDEAAMADTRTLNRIAGLVVDAGGRVVLAGDHRQLPEVGAGGGFAYAASHARTVAELVVNRRQKQPWEQTALTALRDGNVADAVDAYLDRGRVIVAADGRTMIDIAVNAWFDAHAAGISVVLQAGTNELVDRLNRTILDRLTAPEGPLDQQASGQFGAATFTVGQRVVIRRNYTDYNDTNVKVTNGQAGTITGIGHRSITVDVDGRDAPVTLDQGFLAVGGFLSHGYAATTHRSQGGTWDAAIAVGLDGLYREGAYTALSRGRHSNTLIMTDPEIAQLEGERRADPPPHHNGLRLPTEEPGTARNELSDRVSLRRGKQFAHTIDPEHGRIDQLAANHTYPELVVLAARAAQIERLATDRVGAGIDHIVERLNQNERLANHIAPGVRVRASDRRNIGTVAAVFDNSATAAIRFTAPDGREVTRLLHWNDLTIIDRAPQERPTSPATQAWLDKQTSELDQTRTEWSSIVHGLGATPGDADRYRRAADQQLARAVNSLSADMPEWLDRLVGPRPLSPQGATVWDSIVTDIARHRLHHSIHCPGLGTPATTYPDAERQRLEARIDQTRAWLTQHPERAQSQWPIVPSPRDLRNRRSELEAVIATAPPDQRRTVAALVGGQLSLDDTQQLLDTANQTQRDRHAWIIEHWPQIIETAEITRALDTGTYGPDIDTLADAVIQTTSSPALRDAAQLRDRWLAAALNAAVHRNDTWIDNATLIWLEDVADYRSTNNITGRDPVGVRPVESVQASVFDELVARPAEMRLPQSVEMPIPGRFEGIDLD